MRMRPWRPWMRFWGWIMRSTTSWRTTPCRSHAPPADYQQLVQSALAQRPDLQSRVLGQQSEQKFARAEWDQLLPSISALGRSGRSRFAPISTTPPNWWGGVRVNLSIPIFNGFLYSSQAKEATYRSQAMRNVRGICGIRSCAMYARRGCRPTPPGRESRSQLSF